jgi:asparagine synthase (glutamine-hydrolysing)
LFWGYAWVQQAARESARKMFLADHGALAALPQYLGFHLPRGLSRLAVGEWTHNLAGLRPGLKSLQRDRHASANQLVFYDLISDFQCSVQESRAMYTRSFLEQLNGSSAAGLFTFDSRQPNIDVALTRLICDTYLRENGVTQGDRLSMASSIELRLPLLDHRLVETVIGLRKARTDVQQPAKAWLKAAIKDLLPDWVMNRPKRGFSPPVTDWHRALFAAHGEKLADGYLLQRGILNHESAQQLSKGQFPDGAITPMSFKALVLEHWCRQMSN